MGWVGGVPRNASETLAVSNQRVLWEINLSLSLGAPIYYESKAEKRIEEIGKEKERPNLI